MTDRPEDVMAIARSYADQISFGSYEFNTLRIADAIMADRASRERGEVRPLEWRELNDRNFKASTIVGEYHIQGVEANANFRLYLDGDEMRPQVGYYRPLDEAKAAAQADYESRIRSCLLDKPEAVEGVVTPPPQLNAVSRWRVFEDTTHGYWGIEIDGGGEADPILYPIKINRERLDRIVDAHNAEMM